MRTRRVRDLTLAALALALFPAAAAAHEGHGLEATLAGVVHWLSSPLHLVSVVVVAAVALAVVATRVVRAVRPARHAPEGRSG